MNYDPFGHRKDTIPGMSVDRAYSELLKDKKGNKKSLEL
jgi:hypothetical protein